VRLIRTVSTVCGVLAAFMILASVLITCQMIFVRVVLGRSTIWQTEAVIYLVIGATTLGLAYVQRLRGHVGVDLLPSLLPAAARRLLAVVVMAATLAMVAAMVWYGWEMFHLAWVRDWKSESVWGFPLWITYLSMPLGFLLLLLQLLADLWVAAFGPPLPAPVRAEA
jgi:TRAP-type C4-dicarboxylate transport system permease small subunit